MKLNYKEFGNGSPALVILHGLFGSLDNWQTLARRFSVHWRVITLDLRNHGRSPHDPDVSIEAMVEDLCQFADDHGLDAFYLLGHSMGGKVAMAYALQYPALVRKLIVVDIAPKAYLRGHDDVFRAMFAVDLEKIKTRADAEEQMKPIIPSFAIRQFLLKNLKKDGTGRWVWRHNLRALYDGYEKILRPVEADWPFDRPALFLRGELSPYIAPGDEPDILAMFPQARFVTIPGAGHWVHAEAPDRFYEAVHRFLTG